MADQLDEPEKVTFCHKFCGLWGSFLLCIKFPIRFEDKGLWFLFWSIVFPAITFNIGFSFQNALNWNWGLGEHIQHHSGFYRKMQTGQSDQITFGDLLAFSFFNLFGSNGVFGTIALWVGFLTCIWALHAPLKYMWKQFLVIFLIVCVFSTFLAPIIVLGIDPNSWTNYNVSQQYVIEQIEHNAMYQALGGLYSMAPWWFDAYWTYLNIVQGIIYGITQPILFYYYLIKLTKHETLVKQWYGFYDFYSKFYFCMLYGLAIFCAQIVGIQGFTPAFFFIFLWYKQCWCGVLCKTNKDIEHLKYRGDEKGDPGDRGVYCCSCLPCIPCIACFLRPLLNLELAVGELELSLAAHDEEAKKKLEEKLAHLLAYNDKHFGKTIGKIVDYVEEGIFEAIIELISVDEARHWWTYDLIKEFAKIRFSLPEDNDPGLHIADAKPYRLPQGVKQVPAGSADDVMRTMCQCLAENKKMKPVGSGYAWTEILGTSVEDGMFIDTMLATNVDSNAIESMKFFEFRKEEKKQEEETDSMAAIIDYDEYKDLLLPAWRAKYDEDYIVCVGAGCTYYALNEHTWPRPPPPKEWVPNGNINALQRQTVINPETGKPYKMLANQPGYQGLSIGGTINVGVQGTGTQKTPNVISQDSAYPVYEPDRSLPPGDYIRSLTMLIAGEDGTTRKVQVEPASNPFHDATKWREKFGDDATFELIQDDDVFYGSLVTLGTVGIHTAYIFELMDASFEEEHRYIMTWQEFKTTELAKIEKGVQDGEIIRWQLWLSPYKTPGKFIHSKFHDSPPVVVSTYRKTDKVPERILNAKNSGDARTSLGLGITAGAAATWISQVFPHLTPFLLEMTLRGSVYGKSESEHYISVDPFAAVALGASVLVPSIAVGNAVDYEHLVASIEAWQEFGQQQFPNAPVTVPTAARFSCASNQLLSLSNGTPTVWYESVTLDWSGSKWPHVGKVPNGVQHLFGVNRLFHESDQFKGRYNWGLDFDAKNQKANIWRNQQAQITQFVENVYTRFTFENGPFCNQFTVDSGLNDMAFGGKTISDLITPLNPSIGTATNEQESKEEEEEPARQ